MTLLILLVSFFFLRTRVSVFAYLVPGTYRYDAIFLSGFGVNAYRIWSKCNV